MGETTYMEVEEEGVVVIRTGRRRQWQCRWEEEEKKGERERELDGLIGLSTLFGPNHWPKYLS